MRFQPLFRILEPTFLGGLLDDPILLIRVRPKAGSILVDCGYLNHLPKRTLKGIDTVCLTHAHMDHFIGFDQLVRSILVFTAENRDRIRSLLPKVTLLICECTYLQEQRDRARASNHLCTADLNELLRDLSPAYVLPMHLSKTFQDRVEQLYQELDLPAGCRLIRLPKRLTPKPMLPRPLDLRCVE